MLLVLQVRPLVQSAVFFIPISGMIIGNSMTGIALGANCLCANMQDHREKIENSLMLGASPKLAAHEEANDALTAPFCQP